MGHRKMPAYGEREHGGRYILDEYEWSRNHCKAVTIRRWKRDLKKKAGWRHDPFPEELEEEDEEEEEDWHYHSMEERLNEVGMSMRDFF